MLTVMATPPKTRFKTTNTEHEACLDISIKNTSNPSAL